MPSPHQSGRHKVARRPTVRGVLIAVDYYLNPEDYPPLTYAVRDAELAYEVLSSGLSTDLCLLVNRDGNREEIQRRVQEIAKRLESCDSFLLTFNGHGAEDPQSNEPTFLTSEFTGWDEYRASRKGGFTLTDVRKWLNDSLPRERPRNGSTPEARPPNGRRVAPKNIIILVDSCYSAGGAALDLSRSADWPRESAVAVIGSATGLAWEDQERGQGLFSRFVLDWWRELLWRGRGTRDLAKFLTRYVQKKIKELFDQRGWPARYRPIVKKYTTHGEVNLSLERLGACPDRTLPIDYFYPPCPAVEEGVLEARYNCAHLRRALTEEPIDLRYSNVLVVSDRLMFTRFQALKVAREIQKDLELQNRSVLCLGANYLQTALPFLCSLDAWRARRWGPFDWTLEPPYLEQTLRGPIDSLVKRLSQERAVIIVAQRDAALADDVQHFLCQCANDSNIRLCLIMHAEDEVPFFFRAHRRIEMAPSALEVQDALSGGQCRVVVHSPRLLWWINQVLHWGGLLRTQEELLGENPHAKVAVYTDIITEVLKCLRENRLEIRLEASERNRVPIGEERLALLAAMCVCHLPRPLRLVQALWEQLRAEGLCSGDEPLDHTLHKLTDTFRLVDKSAMHEQGYVYFLHNLVRWSTLHFVSLKDVSAFAEVNWDRVVARAYVKVLTHRDDQETSQNHPRGADLIWPRAILAHEAITHFIRARAWSEGAKILNAHWECLVNSGYQDLVLQWVNQLEYSLPPKSEEALVVLLHAQSLRRHRQQFQGILDIHNVIRCRTEASWEGGNWQVDSKYARFIWQSFAAVGDYHLAQNHYFQALAVYADCGQWARSQVEPGSTESPEAAKLGFHVWARRAYIFAQFGAKRETECALGQARSFYPTLSEDNRAIAEAQLLTVTCELYRNLEDGPGLYQQAMLLWRQCLIPAIRRDGSEKDNLTQGIARLHMAWACLFRGETVRAWFHALRARQFLNARGIAEHWWIAETEHVAALAIAWTLYRPAYGDFNLWVNKPYEVSDHARQLVRMQLPEQVSHLERLIQIHDPHDPRRAAKLRSALGQLYAQDHQIQRAREVLHEALRDARQHSHPVLAGYVHEALALLNPHQRVDHLRAAANISQSLGLHQQASRRTLCPSEQISFAMRTHFTAGTDADRRRHRRFPCRLDVELNWKGHRLRGVLTDVSKEGFRGHFERPVPGNTCSRDRDQLQTSDRDYPEGIPVLNCWPIEGEPGEPRGQNGNSDSSLALELRGQTDRPLPLFASAMRSELSS